MTPISRHGLVYIPRESWGAITPRNEIGRPMAGAQPHFIVHHSAIPHVPYGASQATEAAAVRGMEGYHAQQGWGGSAYAWYVMQSGRIYEGRGWGRTGAHTVGRNSDSVGVCVVVNGDVHELTDAAWEALREIQVAGVRGGFLRATHRVSGHRDHLPGGKSCPGTKVYPHLKNRLGEGTATPARSTLKRGDGGAAAPPSIRTEIQTLQRVLGMPGYLQTGYFGEQTDIEVRQHQKRYALTVDGVVGPLTWATLTRPESHE